MIYHHTSNLLPTAIKPKVKCRFHAATMLVFYSLKNALTTAAYFLKIHNLTKFQNPTSSAMVKECTGIYLHSPNTSSWSGAQLRKTQG